MYSDPDGSKELIAPAGFDSNGGDWSQWPDAELEQFFTRQGGMEFVILDTATVNRSGYCRPGAINWCVHQASLCGASLQ